MNKKKDLKQGINYFTSVYEQEIQRRETKKQTQERHQRMAKTAEKILEIAKQCPDCIHWYWEQSNETMLCHLHEAVDFPCADFVHKEGDNAEVK